MSVTKSLLVMRIINGHYYRKIIPLPAAWMGLITVEVTLIDSAESTSYMESIGLSEGFSLVNWIKTDLFEKKIDKTLSKRATSNCSFENLKSLLWDLRLDHFDMGQNRTWLWEFQVTKKFFFEKNRARMKKVCSKSERPVISLLLSGIILENWSKTD